MKRVNTSELKKDVCSLLEGEGIPRCAAEVVAEHLVANERIGRRSHGLFRLPGIIRAAPRCGVTECVTSHGHGATVVDAGGLPGIYALTVAMDVVKGQAKINGVAVTGVRGYAGTTGNLGLHAWRAALGGVASLLTCNSDALVAAPGGLRPVVGTNPIAYGFPSEGFPVMGDYASSVLSYGDIALTGLRGEMLPEGVVQDANGRPSRSVADADSGSMLASGGHRGFCQAVLVELLCGALVGGKVGPAPGGDAALVLGFSANAFDREIGNWGSVSDFRSEVERSGSTDPTRAPQLPGVRYQELLQPTPAYLEVTEEVWAIARSAGLSRASEGG
jgi:LDH2 family malate/lactate/ureidoglycolate dehydrogenase